MNNRRDYTAAEISRLGKDIAWQLPDGGLRITFDDGVTKILSTRSVIMLRYYWELFNEFPGGKINSNLVFDYNRYNTETHLKLSKMVFWDVFLGHCEDLMDSSSKECFWDLSKRLYEVTNEIFNDVTSMAGAYCTGLDAEDIYNVSRVEGLSELREKADNDVITPSEFHEAGRKLIMEAAYSGKLRNSITRGLITGTLNKLQVNQATLSRGFIPDINGDTCVDPVHPSYSDGLGLLYDRFYESRGASISLYMQKAPLEISEYNTRMCQFVTGIIDTVYDGDCGGKSTLDWRVTAENLPLLRGKFYMDESDHNVLIQGDEDELVGQSIRLRSITKCSHHDPAHPCKYCAGLTSLTVPDGTSYGHYVSVAVLQKISQKMLGIKHVLASNKNIYLKIDSTNAGFMRLDKENGNLIKLTPKASGKRVFIQLLREDVRFINDILSVDNIHDVVPESITSINKIQIVFHQNEDGTKRSVVGLETLVAGKSTSLTHDFLEYMRRKSWKLIGNQWIEIEMDEWDPESPFLRSTRRGEDMMEVINNLRQFLHSPDKATSNRAKDFTSVEPAIEVLLKMLNDHFVVSFAQAEIFVRGLMAKGQTSYSLPVGDEQFRFIKLKEGIKNRGAGAALAFEGIQDMLIHSPRSYLHDPSDIPMGHPLDYIIQ